MPASTRAAAPTPNKLRTPRRRLFQLPLFRAIPTATPALRGLSIRLSHTQRLLITDQLTGETITIRRAGNTRQISIQTAGHFSIQICGFDVLDTRCIRLSAHPSHHLFIRAHRTREEIRIWLVRRNHGGNGIKINAPRERFAIERIKEASRAR